MSRWFWLGLTLASACHHAPVFAPTVEAPDHCPGTASSMEAEIKVVTINLRHDSDQWPRRFELVADEIARLDPDLIGMQELEISENQGPYLNSLLEKRGHAKYELVSERKSGALGRASGEGIGIMSRWPIEKSVAAPIGDERVAILARIRHPSGGVLDIVNTHLDQHCGDDGEMNRDQETTKLLDLLAREDDCRPTILTGDLNSTDKGHAVDRLRAARFEDSWAKANPNAIGNTGMIKLETGAFEQHPRRRIDFVLTRPAGERRFTPLRSEVVFKNHDRKGFYPSDHFGVFTIFSARL